MFGIHCRQTDSGDQVLGALADDKRRRPDFEPGMKVLQTSALPLGYGARIRCGEATRLAMDPFLPSRR